MAQSFAFNMDCMEAMKEFPDNFFDLAVVDPPYGDGLHAENGGAKGWFTKYNQRVPENHESKQPLRFHGGDRWEKYLNDSNTGEPRRKNIEWDVAPGPEYFEQLFRISHDQIIWGGNYFPLPPTRCFLIWRKLTISENFTMAMAEYAWTSFKTNAKVFEYAPQDSARFHPTQKPVALYAWIFKNYAEPGMKVLDTHLGSGSSRIAAYDAGIDFWGYEIDKTYFVKQEKRFDRHTAQQNLFLME